MSVQARGQSPVGEVHPAAPLPPQPAFCGGMSSVCLVSARGRLTPHLWVVASHLHKTTIALHTTSTDTAGRIPARVIGVLRSLLSPCSLPTAYLPLLAALGVDSRHGCLCGQCCADVRSRDRRPAQHHWFVMFHFVRIAVYL